MSTGTYTMADLIGIQDLARQMALAYGVDNLIRDIQADTAVYNALIDEQVREYAEITRDVTRRSGTDSGTEDTELDETGRAYTQKSAGGYDVAFPLRTYGYAVGWTAKALKRATVEDIARTTLAAQKAYRARIIRQLQAALYSPTNYTTRDFAATRVTLNVKALANGDGTNYGLDVNGNAIATNHSHYLASSTLTSAAVQSLINTVLEHESGQVVIEISALDLGAWQALTGFVAAQDPVIIQPTTATQLALPLDTTKTDNRFVGRIFGANVYTKTWAKSGYAVARIQNGARRALAMRQSAVPGEQGMYLSGTNSAYPLEANQWEWSFGFGANERLAAAVLDYGHSTYTQPS